MTDPLTRRITDNQIRIASDELARDAARLAATATQYAAGTKTGSHTDSGTAWRLAQDATALARLAARIDGMRTIADLHQDEDKP